MPRSSRPKLDSGVAWALGLWICSFPVMLVLLVMVGFFGTVLGVDLGSGSQGDRLLNAAFVAAVLAIEATAAVIGLVAWRQRGQRAGLVIAVLAALTSALFVLLPVLV